MFTWGPDYVSPKSLFDFTTFLVYKIADNPPAVSVGHWWPSKVPGWVEMAQRHDLPFSGMPNSNFRTILPDFRCLGLVLGPAMGHFS